MWTEPKYHGDAVREVLLYRRDARGKIELGDVRIQHYGRTLRVGSFLPGLCTVMVGDTPKTVPEKQQHYRADNQSDFADGQFDAYIQEAYADGWQNYYPEQHGALRNGC